MRFARLTSLVLALSVAGVSSSFALCVTGCTNQTTTNAAHACHKGATSVSVTADTGPCAHRPEVGGAVELTRDTRAAMATAAPASYTTALDSSRMAVLVRCAAVGSLRPIVSPQILRI